jgi:hypothetical protein
VKYLLVCVMLIPLTGCVRNVDGWSIREATKFCGDKGGVHHVVAHIGYQVSARCNNGVIQVLDE